MIMTSLKDELRGEIGTIIHVGERLISIDKGVESIGDSISSEFANAHLMKKQVINEDGSLKETTLYKYDTHGNRISMDAISHNGGDPRSIRYFYNQAGQIIREGVLALREKRTNEYRYDEWNYLTECRTLLRDGTLFEMSLYEYDGQGNLLSVKTKSVTGETVSEQRCEYNSLNQRIRREHYGLPVNCAGRYRWDIRYNETGDKTEEKTTDLIIRYTYQYDNKNNWTRQYCYYNDDAGPNFLHRRTITYRD